MYLSLLLVDVGINPDRPRPGRLWLRNRYRVHQRLCMAFPSGEKRIEDPDFLAPFDEEDFKKQVKVTRKEDVGFLYRVDPPTEQGRVMILVQSGVKPNWDYAFANARHLLAALPATKAYDPEYAAGQKLRFRLFANPVRKVCKHSLDCEGKPFDKKWFGKRVPVPPPEFENWLRSRAEPECESHEKFRGNPTMPGFRIVDGPHIQSGYIHVNKTQKREEGRRMRSILCEGILQVTDAENFRSTLVRGIGPGKAFGFGLLSVAPV